MSAATAPRARPRAAPAPGSPARPGFAVAARSDAVVVGGLVLWTLALAAVTWGRWGDLTMDTGYDLLAGARTASGELPYADYVYYYGPLGPLLLGGIYAVTGPAVWPAVALGLVLAALAIGLTYRLARRFADPLPAGLAGALVAVAALSSANNSYVLPHSTSAPLATVLALAAVLVLSGAATPRRLAAGGILCGLVASTRPELAIALLAAVTAWLAVQVWQARGRRRAAWLDAATRARSGAGRAGAGLRRVPHARLAARPAAREPLSDRLRTRGGPRRARRARPDDRGQRRQAGRTRRASMRPAPRRSSRSPASPPRARG